MQVNTKKAQAIQWDRLQLREGFEEGKDMGVEMENNEMKKKSKWSRM